MKQKATFTEVLECELGKSATIMCKSHDRKELSNRVVWTSKVKTIEYSNDNIIGFETQNTKYELVDDSTN